MKDDNLPPGLTPQMLDHELGDGENQAEIDTEEEIERLADLYDDEEIDLL